MLLGREIERARLAPAPEQDVGILVVAVGHILGEQVRQARELRIERVGEHAQPLLAGLQSILQAADLGDRGGRVAALGANPPDLLRERIAPRLLLLKLGLQGAQLLVPLEQRMRHRRDLAATQRRIERVGLVTPQSEVVHGWSLVRARVGAMLQGYGRRGRFRISARPPC